MCGLEMTNYGPPIDYKQIVTQSRKHFRDKNILDFFRDFCWLYNLIFVLKKFFRRIRMNFGRDLLQIAEDFEHRALNEPDMDFELRDEFFDYDEGDDERIEKIDRKFEHYLVKKKKHEQKKNRLRLGNEWGGIDHEEMEETVDETIIESKLTR